MPIESIVQNPPEDWEVSTSARLAEEFGIESDLATAAVSWGLSWRAEYEALTAEAPPASRERAREYYEVAKMIAMGQTVGIATYDTGEPDYRVTIAAEEAFFRSAGKAEDILRKRILNTSVRVIVDWPQVERVLGTLMEAYTESRFPYNQGYVRLPQDERHMPETIERGTTKHAMFLWNVCYYMRGGMKSVDAVNILSVLYDEHPELFVAHTAAEQDTEELAKLLHRYNLGYRYGQIAGFWVENAKRLVARWDGDPRNIFAGVDSYGMALARIKNDKNGGGFMGFQEKMVSMITYYLMDEGLIDDFTFPLPVDFHVLRVSIANELVRFENVPGDGNILYDRTLEVLRNLYYHYSMAHGKGTLEVCNAVWLLSESSCGKHPGNQTEEPEGRKNRKGRSTVLVPKKIELDDPNQIAAYARSCLYCPVQDTCQWLVPGKIYYVSGELRIRGPRPEYPAPAQASFWPWQETGTVASVKKLRPKDAGEVSGDEEEELSQDFLLPID